MRTSPLWMGVALVLAGPLACEPPAPPVAPVHVAPPVNTVAVAPEAPTYDLAAVAEPTDVIGLLRWKSPMVDLNNLGACSNVPAMILGEIPRIGLGKAFAKAFHDQVDATALAALVALDAPVDAVVALDATARSPRPIFAAAIGLTSLD